MFNIEYTKRYCKRKIQFFQDGKEDGRIEPSAADKIIEMIQKRLDKIKRIYEA